MITSKIKVLSEEALLPYQTLVRKDGSISFGNDIDGVMTFAKPHFRGDFYAPRADAEYIEAAANNAVKMAELLEDMSNIIAFAQFSGALTGDRVQEVLQRYNAFQEGK